MAKLIKRKTNKFANMQRRTVRYWLFRFRTESLGGPSSNGSPKGLKKFFEEQDGFNGWNRFAVDWDIPHANGCTGDPCKCASLIVPLVIIKRKFSVWEEWQATVRTEATIFPGFEKHEKRLDQ